MGQSSDSSKSRMIKSPFPFKQQHSQATHSTRIQSSIQSILSSCKVVGTFSPPYFYLQQPLQSRRTIEFLPLIQPTLIPIFHFPTCSQNHRYNPHQRSLPLYLSHFSPLYFYIQPSLQPPPKILSPTTTIQPVQVVSKTQWAIGFCLE